MSRCKACNNIIEFIVWIPEKKIFEDLCPECKSEVFSDLAIEIDDLNDEKFLRATNNGVSTN